MGSTEAIGAAVYDTLKPLNTVFHFT